MQRGQPERDEGAYHPFRDYVKQTLAGTKVHVWNEEYFPPAHRPIISEVKSDIRIEVFSVPHPLLHPNLTEAQRTNLAQERQVLTNFIGDNRFYFVPDTRKIKIPNARKNHTLFVRPDAAELYLIHPRLYGDAFRYELFYEVGRSITQTPIDVTPDLYTTDEAEGIEALQSKAFAKGLHPGIQDTRLDRSGFVKRVYVGDGYIGQIFPDFITRQNIKDPYYLSALKTELLNSLYPFAYAFVSDQLYIRVFRNLRDNFDPRIGFDEDLEKFTLSTQVLRSYYLGTTAHLITTLSRNISWQNLLDALSNSNLSVTLSRISDSLKPKSDVDYTDEAGRIIVENLIAAMFKDFRIRMSKL